MAEAKSDYLDNDESQKKSKIGEQRSWLEIFCRAVYRNLEMKIIEILTLLLVQ